MGLAGLWKRVNISIHQANLWPRTRQKIGRLDIHPTFEQMNVDEWIMTGYIWLLWG